MVHLISSFVLLVAAVVSAKPAPNSDISTTCPAVFSYEREDKPGQRSGKLVVESENDLTGVWVRLVFDKAVENVEVEGHNFEAKKLEDGEAKNEILIKNRNFLLKPRQPITLKISVKYEGSEAPNLIEYRLNARTVCPEKLPNFSEFYQGDAKASDFFSSLFHLPLSSPKPHKCGEKLHDGRSWFASIFINDQYVCEAALIDPSHVLTSAHCVTSSKNEAIPLSPKYVSVYFGGNGAAKDAVRANVSAIHVHPGYEVNTLYDDLALIKLASEVDVMPICLGDEKSEEGTLVAGYENGDRDGSGEVFMSKVRKVDEEKCPKELQEVLADGQFCVSYLPDNEKCAGNSGGSFISVKDNKATLNGIVSLGLKLQNKNECKENTASIITDTSRYLKWLQRYLRL